MTEWGFAKDIESTKHRFCEGEILFGKIRPYFYKVAGVCFGVDPDQPKPNVDVTAIGRFALACGWTQVDSQNPALEIYERTNAEQQIQVPISGHIDDTTFMLAEVLLRLATAEGLTLDELKVELGSFTQQKPWEAVCDGSVTDQRTWQKMVKDEQN